MYLIVDTREGSVIPFLDTELRMHAYVTRQVNTGDYLVCRKQAGAEPAIIACIERKTLTDFAASFKDGRYENIRKMRALREKTGCQLYFFVEGPAFPSPNRRFDRIPFANIQAAITKLMVRDGVLVVQTENEAHTAKRLADFLRAFEAEPHYQPESAAPAEGGSHAADNGEAAGALAADPADELDGGDLAVPDILTERIDQTDAEAATIMWARLKGVSAVLGKILTREFSVADLVGGRVGDRVRTLRTATGRRINAAALEGLLALQAGSVPLGAKLVSGLRGVTLAAAETILASAGGLAGLCAMGTAAMAAIALPQKGRTIRLGAARAGRIRRALHYVEDADGPAAPPPEPEGHVLGGRDLRKPPSANKEARNRARKAARHQRNGAASAGLSGARGPAREAEQSIGTEPEPVPEPEPEPEPEQGAPAPKISDSDVDEVLAAIGF